MQILYILFLFNVSYQFFFSDLCANWHIFSEIALSQMKKCAKKCAALKKCVDNYKILNKENAS